LKWLWRAGVAWFVAWHGLYSLTLDLLTASISLISPHWSSAAASLLDERTYSFPINAAADDIDAAGRC
jgi:hypothetical protein